MHDASSHGESIFKSSSCEAPGSHARHPTGDMRILHAAGEYHLRHIGVGVVDTDVQAQTHHFVHQDIE